MRPKTREKIVYVPRVRDIRLAMADNDISIRALSNDLKESLWTLRHALRGHTFCPSTVADKVAGYLDRDVKDLFIVIDLENPEMFLKANAA